MLTRRFCIDDLSSTYSEIQPGYSPRQRGVPHVRTRSVREGVFPPVAQNPPLRDRERVRLRTQSSPKTRPARGPGAGERGLDRERDGRASR